MKKLALIFLFFACPQIVFANASDDQGFHDCRLAANEVAQSFFDKAVGILALRSSREMGRVLFKKCSLRFAF